MYYWDDPFLVSYDKDQLNNGKNLLFTSFGNTTFHFSLIDKLTHTLSINPCEIKYFDISSINTNQFLKWKQYIVSNHNNQIKPILLVIGNTNKINNNNLLELQQLNILFKLSDYTSDLTNIITLLTIDIDFVPTNETLGTRRNYDTFKWKHYLQSKWKSSFVEFNTNALIGRISRAVIQSPSEPILPLQHTPITTTTTHTNSIHDINESTIRLLCIHNSDLFYNTRMKLEEFYAYTLSTYKLGYDIPMYTKLQHFGHNLSTISTLSIIFYTFLFVCFYIALCCRPVRHERAVSSKPTSVPPPTNDTTTTADLPSLDTASTTIPSTTTKPTTDIVISSTIEVKLIRSSRSRYNVQLAEATSSSRPITRSSRPNTRREKPNLDVDHTEATIGTTTHTYINNAAASSSTQAVHTRDATSTAAVSTVTTGRSVSRTRTRTGPGRRPLRARSASKKSD